MAVDKILITCPRFYFINYSDCTVSTKKSTEVCHNTANKGNLLSKIGDSLKISVPAAKNKYSHLRKDFNEKPL